MIRLTRRHFSLQGRAISLSILVVGAVGASMACSTAGTPSGNATPRGTSSAGTSSTTGNAVTVELKEWSIAASPGSASAGAVSFTTRNSGTTPHDLVVIKTDVAPDKLETDSSGAVDESKYTVGGKITQLDAGKS